MRYPAIIIKILEIIENSFTFAPESCCFLAM